MLGYKPIGSLTNLQFIPKGQKAELYFLALNPALEKLRLRISRFPLRAADMLQA